MEDNLIFLEMEDDLNFLYMEDDLNFLHRKSMNGRLSELAS
jgi:hypothetical protein